MSDPYYPPRAFAFSVGIAGVAGPDDAAFQEVSGIDPQVQTGEPAQGGVNAYVHQLPGVVKHSNLVLERGYVTPGSALAEWAGQVVGSALGTPIVTKALNVSLLGLEGRAMVRWTYHNAWPVKWESSSLDGDTMLTEVLELAYTTVTRTPFPE